MKLRSVGKALWKTCKQRGTCNGCEYVLLCDVLVPRMEEPMWDQLRLLDRRVSGKSVSDIAEKVKETCTKDCGTCRAARACVTLFARRVDHEPDEPFESFDVLDAQASELLRKRRWR